MLSLHLTQTAVTSVPTSEVPLQFVVASVMAPEVPVQIAVASMMSMKALYLLLAVDSAAADLDGFDPGHC